MMQSIKPKHFADCTLFNELLCILCQLRIHQHCGFTHTDHDTDARLNPIFSTPVEVQDLNAMLAAIQITSESIRPYLPAGRFQGAYIVSGTSLFHRQRATIGAVSTADSTAARLTDMQKIIGIGAAGFFFTTTIGFISTLIGNNR